MRYEISASSVAGSRKEQQDSFRVRESADAVAAIVCDGMGGLTGGALASGAAADRFIELYSRKAPDESRTDFMANAVRELDECVYKLSDARGVRLRAGTTAAAAVIDGDALCWLSVGDSRIYIARGGEIQRITRDHNYFLTLGGIKTLTREQYEAEAKRGDALISFIGMGGIDVMDINTSPLTLLHGDALLLTSDGLYKAVDEKTIGRVLCDDLPDKAPRLTHLADNSGPRRDNTTCIVIKYLRS
ncbi:MAG: protein phosphatase 2C domain-containing protein [Oscillospiraceae bacterium]|nr:protein phosphatase 2C domain-containing protein [Oscillospiraceae bacterium]